MFDSSDPAVLLLQRMGSAARTEAQAAAQRLVAIADFMQLRLAEGGDGTEEWWVDATGAATVEIAAALGVSRGQAGAHVRYARALREQLPLLGERFLAGDVDEATFRAAAFRTGLILDDAILAGVDAVLARRAPRWGRLNRTALDARIDAIVAEVDLDAVRRREHRVADRGVTIEGIEHGLAYVTATVYATDAAAVSARLTELANTVCGDDPRTFAQRRADAMAALAVGAARMACHCRRDDCPAGGTGVTSAVVIHVVADQAALDGDRRGVAVTAGYEGVIPPEVVAELARDSRLRPVLHPGTAAEPECGYRPSRGLANFVRARDLTCRFPGCEVAAFDCDVDHTVPWSAGGRTHASNLKCLCRFHHLCKTFWGWRDEQAPDGTVLWTSPAGECYPTSPGSGEVFPALSVPTGPATPANAGGESGGDRTAMMPRRRQTRTKQQAADILAERHANRERRINPPPLHRCEEDYTYEETFLENRMRQPEPPPPF
ncbi:HNH endonuclease signature motif containing protein [Mycolicibacterium sediminis]|uniref:HNH endonuclease signature motif containing protein n=2 Tax=Mycolicibacterium sediminis TaxID=1286180 RepID=UPI0013D3EC3D|nr:HNH endonuclease signature motif containing protein [Mycolicibacterium sediminis]